MELDKDPKEQIQVFDANPEDIDDVMDVMKKTWIDTYPNAEAGITKEDIEDHFRQMEEKRQHRVSRMQNLLDDPGRHLFVAKEGHTVVGYCWVAKAETYNQVGALYVLSSYQGQGIGTSLMEKGLEWLGSGKELRIEVASYNQKAIYFYKSFGLTETGKPSSGERHCLSSGKLIPVIELFMK